MTSSIETFSLNYFHFAANCLFSQCLAKSDKLDKLHKHDSKEKNLILTCGLLCSLHTHTSHNAVLILYILYFM